MEMIQGSPRVVNEKIRPPKGCVPLGTYKVEETKGLIDESYVDCWVAKSYKADGYNGVLKAIICTQCHVTPMGSYMVGSRKVKRLNGN